MREFKEVSGQENAVKVYSVTTLLVKKELFVNVSLFSHFLIICRHAAI